MSTTPKALYRDEGIVLRTQKLGEADRIVTVLTRRTGKVRAVAKGVRRTKSKFGARLEPFTHVDLQLYTGRNLDIVSQVESIRSYGQEIVETLVNRPGFQHVVVTGRDASPGLIAAADLVSEVVKIKHPMDQGIRAQQGIES